MSKSLSGAADLLAVRAARTNAPTSATLQVTDRCNYDCVHCYQEHDARPDELTLAEIQRILGELADAGVLFLVLMGGEFFMRRDADEVLQLARDLGFAIRLKTTGHHVTERRADFLATLRPIEVDLSLYAAGQHVHEQVTRQASSWARTVEAARRLVARKVPVVLRCPVMQVNAGEIEGLTRLAKELGAEVSFDAKITAREDNSLEPVGLRMDDATLRTFYRDAMGEFLAEQFQGFDACSGTREGQEVNGLDWAPCSAGRRSVGIDPQGKIWPCNALPVPAGDLRMHSFREIWFGSEVLEDVRGLTWARISECNECALRPYCSRCHAMALIEHGEMRGPSLEACRHAVAIRDTLRERGVIPATETAMPPTWDRIDVDGQHERTSPRAPATGDGKRRARGLRVLP